MQIELEGGRREIRFQIRKEKNYKIELLIYPMKEIS
jgi:hypothetical protein